MKQMEPAVIFIHGYNKKLEYWNKNEFGKEINIEKTISKKSYTLLIQIDNFEINPAIGIIPIIEQMKLVKNKNWIIVCHSLGVIYGLELLKHDIKIVGMCLIDPTSLDEIYIKELIDDNWMDIANYCSTEKYNPSSKIIFHTHFDYNQNDVNNVDYFNRQIKFYGKFINKNNKSKIIIHPNKGHMIHYTDSPKIINSISDLIEWCF